MKKFKLVLFGAFLSALFILAGCGNILDTIKKPAAGTGLVSIHLGPAGPEASRTLAPAGFTGGTSPFTSYKLSFSGPDGASHADETITGASVEVALAAGEWTITAEAFAAETPQAAASGSAAITVPDGGAAEPVTITLVPHAGGENGTFGWNITGIDPATTATLILTEPNGAAISSIEPINLKEEAQGNRNLEAGYYQATIELGMDRITPAQTSRRMEIAHIYAGMTTNWTTAFTANNYPKMRDDVYIGLISFAGGTNNLTGGSLVLLDVEGRNSLLNQLNADYTISSQSGTALFYAVHEALADLKSRESLYLYPDNLDSVTVITFTDGLDNGSTGMSALQPIEDQTFDTDTEYTEYLSGEITNRTIAGKSITAYSVGVAGSDVADTAKFRSNLEKIASPDKSYFFTSYGEVQSAFQTIAESLYVTHINTSFTMKTTLLSSGTKVRMTFDVTSTDSNSAEASAKYIEGTVTRTGAGADMVYTFNDISYAEGFGSEQEAGPITGVINGTEVNFAFTGVTGYVQQTDESRARQWLMPSDSTTWQHNSEYDVGGATDIQVEKYPSIIYLVLDSSTSLSAYQIGQIRDVVRNFINSLYSQLNPSGS
jgi:hypothetical protein